MVHKDAAAHMCDLKYVGILFMSNSSIHRFTLRVIASLITIYSQYILTLAASRAGQHQNNTSERLSLTCYVIVCPPKCTKSILTRVLSSSAIATQYCGE